MALPGWYNENQFRDYPFVGRSESYVSSLSSISSNSVVSWWDLPTAAVVEAGVVMDIDAGFDPAVDQVYLHSVSRAGSSITFELRTTAPGAGNYALRFYRQLDAAEFEIQYAQAEMISPEPVALLQCSSTAPWSGYMITGDVSVLAESVGDGDTILLPPSLWLIEPARIQTMMASYLRSVSLANFPRTKVTEPAGCETSSSSSDSSATDSDDVFVSLECAAGDLVFESGYNCHVRIDSNSNAVIIGSGVGLGAGELCEEVALTEDEAILESLLSGGPACHELIKTINGVPGPNVTIAAGPGFQVYVADDGALVVDRSLHDFALCPGVETDSSISGGA